MKPQVVPYSSEVAMRMMPRLSRQTRNDMAALGITEEQVRQYLKSLDDTLFAFLAVDERGEPFATFGITFYALDLCESFMICTDECFEKYGKWVTVQIIRLLKSDRLDPFPGVKIEMYTGNESTAAKWFETIGFCKDNDYTNDKVSKYVYRR
jgi:hypothetical protein